MIECKASRDSLQAKQLAAQLYECSPSARRRLERRKSILRRRLV